MWLYLSLMYKVFKSIAKVCASPILTVFLLFYSVGLIFIATIAQLDMGVELAAEKYFESFFVLANLGGIKIPLMGGASVGVLFVVNVIFSMFARLTFGASGVGNSIMHFALVLLVLSGGLQFFMREEGRVVLRDGATTNIVSDTNSGALVCKLPFSIRLLKFTRENWPGSKISKSYSSRVVFISGNSSTEALIEMNSPASYMGWSFYQMSYSEDPRGGNISVLSAVKNPARLLPWLSVAAAFVGMLMAFTARAWRRRL